MPLTIYMWNSALKSWRINRKNQTRDWLRSKRTCELQRVINKTESETTIMSGNERRRDGYERLTNNFERFLNQQRTVQERLSNSYQTAQDRYRTTQERLSNSYQTAINRVRNGYERLSNRSVSEDKERLLKDDRKSDMQTIKTTKNEINRSVFIARVIMHQPIIVYETWDPMKTSSVPKSGDSSRSCTFQWEKISREDTS